MKDQKGPKRPTKSAGAALATLARLGLHKYEGPVIPGSVADGRPAGRGAAMTGDVLTLPGTLAWSARARSQARNLRAEAEKLALQVADTEEAMARALARLAAHHPPNECRLRAIAEAAASHAEWEREQAAGSPPPGAGGGS